MSAATEDRAKQSMDDQVDALVAVELDRLDDQRFFPDHLARRVTQAYAVPGKDDARDPRVKIITLAYVTARLKRVIQRSRNGLRLWIPIGGGQWQYAPATTARQVRVFRDGYQEAEHAMGARKDRLDQVLDAHFAKGLAETDSIRDTYESALEGALLEAAA